MKHLARRGSIIYENDQQDATVQDNLLFHYSLTAQHVSSDIFAHHQEHLNSITASGITQVCRCQLAATYVCNTRSCNTVQMLLMMKENIARNMQSSKGIINYPRQLHLVGHFPILYHDARSGNTRQSRKILILLTSKWLTFQCDQFVTNFVPPELKSRLPFYNFRSGQFVVQSSVLQRSFPRV